MLVPLDDSIMALEQDSEATGSVGAGGRLTTGAAPTAVNQPGTPTSSAVKSPAVIPAATTPLNDGIKVAFSTVKIPGSQVDKSQVDKSQGSFAAINKLLHSFTSSSTRQPKHAVKKAIALTDAQMADIRYTSKDAFAGSAFHILHRGANYVVYIVTAKETGLKLLLKAYDMGKMNEPEIAAVRSEIDMLTRLTHVGIARCRGNWQDLKHLYSVQEYGIRGDLFIEMFSERHRLTERFIACKVLHPLLQALAHLHSHNIVHRSVLPENLHFDKDLNIKLTHFATALDLGAGPVPEGPDSFSVVDYLAPEILKHTASSSTCSASASPDTGAQLFPFGEEYTISSAPGSKVPPLRKAAQEAKTGYDQKVDVWAVGCLLFELLTGKGPFEVPSKDLTCALILWGDIQHFPDKLSQPCTAFIQACLTKDPTARPSAEELLHHDWVVRQRQADAAGIPEGLEFKPGEQQVAASSGMWVKRQLSKMRSVTEPGNSSQPASTSRFRIRMPRLWRKTPADIEMGQYSISLHSDIKRQFGTVNPMRS